MSDDVKHNLDLMRATLTVVEIVAPFTPRERLGIITGALVMSGCKKTLIEAVSADAAEEIIARMTARTTKG